MCCGQMQDVFDAVDLLTLGGFKSTWTELEALIWTFVTGFNGFNR
jgi:hypothetical protein